MLRNIVHVVCLAVMFGGSVVLLEAQATSTAPTASSETRKASDGGAPSYIRPETPEQRLARIGTTTDPGPDPDPTAIWWRFGKAYKIDRYDRHWAVYEGGQDKGFIRPFGFVNSYRELYQHNELYVWVWEPVRELNPEPPVQEDLQKSIGSERRYGDDAIKYLENIRPEFYELNPRESATVVRFQESSDGLPNSGSWRSSLAVADMNNDGNVDLIAPPERAGGTIPSIFLGDGKGGWKYWDAAIWPHAIDYGSAAAADFNKDGMMDLVFSVHLSGVYVFIGDGKGKFTAPEPVLQGFPTRRVAVVDADRDGYMDIVAISEGPTAMQTASNQSNARIALILNRKKGTAWETAVIADRSRYVGGDWMTVGDFNADKIPDFAGSSVFFNSNQTLYLSNAKKGWSMLERAKGPQLDIVTGLSYYFANSAGKFSSTKNDDLLVSYVRIWPGDLNPKLIPVPPLPAAAGIDRISFAGGAPKRTPVMRWGGTVGVWGLASADLNGDGKIDALFTRNDPREFVLLLGDGRGGFTRAKIEGLQFLPMYTYDVKVADVNKDGRPDVIMMYEADSSTGFTDRNGSIRVYLNRGASATGTTATATPTQ